MNDNELIKITTNQSGIPSVSGRELHEFLQVNEKYTQWFDRMAEYGFNEGEDFWGFSQISEKPQGGRPSIDHAMSLDMAKEIAMLQRSDRGKQARLYFIECERRLAAGQTALTGDELIMAAMGELQRRVSKLTSTVEKGLRVTHTPKALKKR